MFSLPQLRLSCCLFFGEICCGEQNGRRRKRGGRDEDRVVPHLSSLLTHKHKRVHRARLLFRRRWACGAGHSRAGYGRYIVNDSFRTDVCLYYKPHMIAMAALLLACTFHECTRPSPSLNLRWLPAPPGH